MTRFISTNSKPTIPTMKKKRITAAVAAIDDNSFVVLGGFDDKYNLKAQFSCEVYDGNTNEWKPLAKNIPGSREDCAAVTIGRHIYVVGGMNHGTLLRRGKLLSTMEAYSLDKKKWEPKKPMKEARCGCAAAVSNGRLFVFGGEGSCGTVNSSEVYDPGTDTWKDLPPMSQKRQHCTAVTVDDKIYVVGGFNTEDYDHSSIAVFNIIEEEWEKDINPVSSVEIFNVTTEQWEKGPDMPSPRFYHAAIAIGKSIVIIGGEDCNCKPLSSSLIYNIYEKKWSDGPSMTIARTDLTAVTINKNRVVVAGGCNSEVGSLNTAEMIELNLSSTSR